MISRVSQPRHIVLGILVCYVIIAYKHYWDITILKNFSQKCDRRTDEHVKCYVSTTIMGRQQIRIVCTEAGVEKYIFFQKPWKSWYCNWLWDLTVLKKKWKPCNWFRQSRTAGLWISLPLWSLKIRVEFSFLQKNAFYHPFSRTLTVHIYIYTISEY